MVKPGALVPYETFNQFIRDRFKIYTRTTNFNFNFSRYPDVGFNKTASQIHPHSILIAGGKSSFFLTSFQSEVMMLERQAIRKKKSTKEAAKIELIKNHSRLLPQLMDIFEDACVAFKKWLSSPNKEESPPHFLESQRGELDSK